MLTLANNAPPNDKKPTPPEGLSWGDGELRVPKRNQPAPSNDVKGLFTDSVIAQLPVSDMAVEDEDPTEVFSRKGADPGAGQWREPGTDANRPIVLNSLRARSNPISASVREVAARAASRPVEVPNAAGAAAAAAFAAPREPISRTRSAESPAREAPAGALTAPQPAPSRTRAVSADVAPLAEAQGTRTLEFDGGPSGLELDAPEAARASSIQPKQARLSAASLKPVATASHEAKPLPSRDPKLVEEHVLSLRPAVSLRAAPATPVASVAPAAAAAQLPKSKPTADDEEVPRSPSGRPLAKQKRAEARRAARRAAAKHLPPPPASSGRGWDPPRIVLAAFSAVVGLSALVIGAATAGLITLPPATAAMLGLDSAHASLSQAKPRGKTPNLVMPNHPAQPAAAPAPAVVRLADPAVPVAPPSPQPAAATGAAAPAPPAAATTSGSQTPAEPVVAQPAAVEAPAARTAVAQLKAAAANAPATPVAAPEPETPPPPSAAAAGPASAAVTPRESDEIAADSGETADAARLVRIARGLLAKDPPGAAEMMMRAIKQNPDDHHAMEVLVRAWIAMGRGKDAVGYAEYIVKKRPKRAIYRLLQGDAKQLAGDRAGAEAAWRAVLALEPNDPDAKRRLGL